MEPVIGHLKTDELFGRVGNGRDGDAIQEQPWVEFAIELDLQKPVIIDESGASPKLQSLYDRSRMVGALQVCTLIG